MQTAISQQRRVPLQQKRDRRGQTTRRFYDEKVRRLEAALSQVLKSEGLVRQSA
jgi:hypothetical protein